VRRFISRSQLRLLTRESSLLVGSHIDLLIKKAKVDKLPFVAQESVMAESGALLAYGSDLRLSGAQAARLGAKVLKGEKHQSKNTTGRYGSD